jgi:hypothetical protein
MRISPVGITLDGVKEIRAHVERYNSEHADDLIVTTADIANKIIKPATETLAKGEQAYVIPSLCKQNRECEHRAPLRPVTLSSRGCE